MELLDLRNYHLTKVKWHQPQDPDENFTYTCTTRKFGKQFIAFSTNEYPAEMRLFYNTQNKLILISDYEDKSENPVVLLLNKITSSANSHILSHESSEDEVWVHLIKKDV